MNVQGKVAIITGAASGIGQATAAELAERGVKALGLVDCSEQVLRAARSINDMAGGAPMAEGFVGDVTDAAFRKKVFDHVQSKYGLVQICIPAAGITRVMLPARNRRDFEDIPEEVRNSLEFIWLQRVEDAVAQGLQAG